MCNKLISLYFVCIEEAWKNIYQNANKELSLNSKIIYYFCFLLCMYL